jgi:hypothetical protein
MSRPQWAASERSKPVEDRSFLASRLSGVISTEPSPIDPPAFTGHSHPKQFLLWCFTCVMVEDRCSLVETASVGRVSKSEPLKIEMVTELMAQRAEKRAEGGDPFVDGCPHPHPDNGCIGMIIAE